MRVLKIAREHRLDLKAKLRVLPALPIEERATLRRVEPARSVRKVARLSSPSCLAHHGYAGPGQMPEPAVPRRLRASTRHTQSSGPRMTASVTGQHRRRKRKRDLLSFCLADQARRRSPRHPLSDPLLGSRFCGNRHTGRRSRRNLASPPVTSARPLPPSKSPVSSTVSILGSGPSVGEAWTNYATTRVWIIRTPARSAKSARMTPVRRRVRRPRSCRTPLADGDIEELSSQ